MIHIKEESGFDAGNGEIKIMPQKKILIVDDEPAIVHSLEKHLSKSNYDLISASDGVQALELAKNGHPDLIILDLMLPKMDGYKVCGLLKSDKRYKDIPIIFCSGRAGQEDKDLSKEVGGDAYLTKPLDINLLDDEIDKLIGLPSETPDEEILE